MIIFPADKIGRSKTWTYHHNDYGNGQGSFWYVIEFDVYPISYDSRHFYNFKISIKESDENKTNEKLRPANKSSSDK